jgi:hypothetical protein
MGRATVARPSGARQSGRGRDGARDPARRHFTSSSAGKASDAMSQQSLMETMSPTPASYSARIMYPAQALSRSQAMTLGYDHPAPEHLRSVVAGSTLRSPPQISAQETQVRYCSQVAAGGAPGRCRTCDPRIGRREWVMSRLSVFCIVLTGRCGAKSRYSPQRLSRAPGCRSAPAPRAPRREVLHGLVLEHATQGRAELVHGGVGARGGWHAAASARASVHSGRGGVAQ